MSLSDEVQRKRKVEESEEQPSKRKSIELVDVNRVSGEATDISANALQKLTLVLDPEEQEEAVPDTRTEPDVRTKQLPSGTLTSECSPEEASISSCQSSVTGIEQNNYLYFKLLNQCKLLVVTFLAVWLTQKMQLHTGLPCSLMAELLESWQWRHNPKGYNYKEERVGGRDSERAWQTKPKTPKCTERNATIKK